jgi:hypothetical protein
LFNITSQAGWYTSSNFLSAHTQDSIITREDVGILNKRNIVYNAAKELNPMRWSGRTRNWSHISEVWLNPPKKNQREVELEKAA